MNDITTAVIYARFSSDMQREESIDAQVRACREYAKRQGYLVTKVYKDEARSGKSLIGRDGYNQMMADARDHKFDVIIFHKIDRNARNEFNYYSFKKELAALGIGYEYAAQNIDMSPEGQMMENVLVGFAAYYSRNLAKEVKKGLNENAYKALFNGGTAPLGYKIVDGKYVIDEREAAAVRMIFNLYMDGYGYRKIAHELFAAGYKTREGRDFGKNSLYDIMHNEKYIGTYVFNRTHRSEGTKRNMHAAAPDDIIRIEDALPAIVTKEVFYACQQRAKTRYRRPGACKAKEEYILSGKVFCACGSAMGGHRVTTRGKYYIYYSCLAKDRRSASGCHQRQIPRDFLEDWVLDVIENQVLTEERILSIADDIIGQYKKLATDNDQRKTLMEQKLAAERKLNNIYNIIESNDGDIDEFDLLRLKNAKAELSNVNKMLINCETSHIPILTKEKVIETLEALKKTNIRKLDFKNKKALVDIFVERVNVHDTDIELMLSFKKIFPENIFRSAGAEGPYHALQKLCFIYHTKLA